MEGLGVLQPTTFFSLHTLNKRRSACKTSYEFFGSFPAQKLFIFFTIFYHLVNIYVNLAAKYIFLSLIYLLLGDGSGIMNNELCRGKLAGTINLCPIEKVNQIKSEIWSV